MARAAMAEKGKGQEARGKTQSLVDFAYILHMMAINQLRPMSNKTFASREVQTRFGAVLDTAKREPVTVTQYGRPVVTMMSFELAEEAQRALAGRRMSEFLRRLPRVEAAEALTDEDVNALVHELR